MITHFRTLRLSNHIFLHNGSFQAALGSICGLAPTPQPTHEVATLLQSRFSLFESPT